MSTASKKLGLNIRKIREEKSLTQGDLCRRMSVDRAFMSNLEAGKTNPTLDTIEKVAKALRTPIKNLFD